MPELLDERGPRGAVGRERVRLAPAAVEREHEQGVRLLAQRVLEHERAELRQHLRVPVAAELGLRRGAPARAGGARRAARRPAGRAASSARSASAGPRHSASASPSARAASSWRSCGERQRALLGEPLEAVQIEGERGSAQRVRGPARLDRVAAERLAQRGDAALHEVVGGRGRVLAPELVDQPLGRDERVGADEQQDEERLVAPGPERDRPAVEAAPPAVRGSCSPRASTGILRLRQPDCMTGQLRQGVMGRAAAYLLR